MSTTVSATNSSTALTYVESTGDSSSGLTADTETFLTLLVAQLQYQDPLEPQTDTQFVTQLAQMSSLEQMQGMNASLSNAQACGMIGKYVYAAVTNSKTSTTTIYEGLVSSVAIMGEKTYVVIDNKAIAVSDVIRVCDSANTGSDPDTSTDTNTTSGSAADT